MEIILAIAISFIIILLIGKLGALSSFINLVIDQTIKVRQSSDYVFQTLVTDIRSMGPSSLGAYPVESVSSTSIIFYSDIDRDNLMERVNYFIATSTLNKGVIKPTGNPLVYVTSSEIVISVVSNIDVNGSYFEYFDQSFTGGQSPLSPPVNPQTIRVIKINIAVRTSTSTSSSLIRFSRIITPRNLKTNY
mgnify:FL=1